MYKYMSYLVNGCIYRSLKTTLAELLFAANINEMQIKDFRKDSKQLVKKSTVLYLKFSLIKVC